MARTQQACVGFSGKQNPIRQTRLQKEGPINKVRRRNKGQVRWYFEQFHFVYSIVAL